MEIHSHRDGTRLLERAGAWLEERPAENNLPLGLCQPPAPGSLSEPGDVKLGRLFLTIEEGGAPIGVCLWRPPTPLILTRMPASAVPVLVAHLQGLGIRPEYAEGPAETASLFAEAWIRAVGGRATCHLHEGIYQCSRVERPVGVSGHLRWATAAEAPLLSDWVQAFAVEGHLPEPVRRSMLDSLPGRIQAGTLAVWENERPVCMAWASGATPQGIRIGGVYTPPNERRRGHASACTAALTQRMLDAGRRCCFLYTDFTNPTSNKIYQAIGYAFVCEARVFHFTRS